MLIDDLTVIVSGGNGGNGKVSFGRKALSGPDGGNGGNGGNVFATVTSDLFALGQLAKKKHISAADGAPGGSNNKYGKRGEDTYLIVPIGSTLTNLDTGQETELTELNQKMRLAKGGYGGKGNFDLRSPTNTTPMEAENGKPGETKRFRINLKFIAKYGLIGLPNAGKSSILNEVTNAKAKIGNYPFTTLETNLGAYKGKIIADIPGLIEGAAEGRGLGTKFLKHVEKVELLLHCISVESDNVLADFRVVNDELTKFKPELITKKRVILLTKTDLSDEKTIREKTKELGALGFPILPVSIHDAGSMEKLVKYLGKSKLES